MRFTPFWRPAPMCAGYRKHPAGPAGYDLVGSAVGSSVAFDAATTWTVELGFQAGFPSRKFLRSLNLKRSDSMLADTVNPAQSIIPTADTATPQFQ